MVNSKKYCADKFQIGMGVVALACAAALPVSAATVNAIPGWNLLGYSDASAVNVADAFGDANQVITVWKWNASTNNWAFYSPVMSDGGQAYAGTKGYDFLTTINSGDGFWVNAKASFGATLPAAPAVVVNPVALAGIQSTLASFQALYATAIPPTSSLGLLFDATTLVGGQSKAVFLQDMTSDVSLVGLTFTDIKLVNPADLGAKPNDATHQWFTFNVLNDEGPGSAWLAIKDVNGKWLLAGDQRRFDVWLDVQAYKRISSLGSVSYGSQFDLGVDRVSQAGVVSVMVTGPGIRPSTGVPLYEATQGTIWVPTCGFEGETNCVDIAQAAAGSKYTFKAFTVAGGTATPAYVYTAELKASPLSSAALASASFPSITNVSTNWASGAQVTVNWTLPVGSKSSWLDLYAWGATVGQAFNNMGTRLSDGSTSATLTLPSYSGTISDRTVWLSTRDASGRQLSVEYKLPTP